MGDPVFGKTFTYTLTNGIFIVDGDDGYTGLMVANLASSSANCTILGNATYYPNGQSSPIASSGIAIEPGMSYSQESEKGINNVSITAPAGCVVNIVLVS